MLPLPFLKPKAQASGGVIVTVRKPDGSQETKGMEGEEDQGLMAASDDLIRALHAKDSTGVANALRAAFQILDAEPHEEGGTDEPEQSEGA